MHDVKKCMGKNYADLKCNMWNSGRHNINEGFMPAQCKINASCNSAGKTVVACYLLCSINGFANKG